MDIERRIGLIKTVGEEIVTLSELKDLLETKTHPVAYDGFEPSGRMHIAQGILRAININKMLKAGVGFKVLVADWFAYMNNKMGGDMEKIKKTGEYFIEVWKACGMKIGKLDFVWSDDLMRDRRHWETTVQIAKASSLKRIVRCSQIMGRKSDEKLSASQIIYPCMQAADIFRLKCDITQLGMDQRKVNMLARELGPRLGFWKPVVISHHMVLGLSKPTTTSKDPADILLDLKMSKSRPDSAIFMTDSKSEVERKINKAFCPAKDTEMNPVLEYCKYIIFEKFGEMNIEREERFGGSLNFGNYEELEQAFRKGELHPSDLKFAVAEGLNKILRPVRMHFEKNARARKLYEFVKNQEVTR